MLTLEIRSKSPIFDAIHKVFIFPAKWKFRVRKKEISEHPLETESGEKAYTNDGKGNARVVIYYMLLLRDT